MDIAAAKKHLRSIRYDQVKIMQLMDKRDELRLSLYPKAITYDGDRVQTTLEDVLSERVAALLAIEDNITRAGYKLDIKIVQTREVIRNIPDDKCRTLLILYYTCLTQDGNLYRWDDVAGHIGRATTYIIQKLHPKALEYYANYSFNMLT